MISVRCPHCQIGLKVDEGKIPLGITSFKCPNCKQSIPVSLLKSENSKQQDDSETVLLQHSVKTNVARLLVVEDEDTPSQEYLLHEGDNWIGRKSQTSTASIQIQTNDRFMSRNHICISVKKDTKGGYKYYLSDNNSKNRALYNSNYLEKEEVVVLSDGDEIVIGKTLLRFKV